jgi:hypothetical protein
MLTKKKTKEGGDNFDPKKNYIRRGDNVDQKKTKEGRQC